MFNVGGGELIVIALVALIVLGPQRLPEAARQVGKVLGDLRKLSSGFQNEMKTAFVEADDPTRVAARRNVLAKEAPTETSEETIEEPEADDAIGKGDPEETADTTDPAVTDAIAAVAASREPPPTAKSTPPAGSKLTSATQKALGEEPLTEPAVPESPPPRSAL